MMSARLKLILFTSVAVNLLLVGVIAGRFSLFLMPPPPPHEMHHDGKSMEPPCKHDSPWKREIDAFIETLPAEKAKIAKELFDGARKSADAQKEKVEGMRMASIKLLRAEPFNGKIYLEQSQAIAHQRSQSMIHFIKATIELANHLDSKERNALADAFDRSIKASRPPLPTPPSPPQDHPHH